jgi:hypothetical protein
MKFERGIGRRGSLQSVLTDVSLFIKPNPEGFPLQWVTTVGQSQAVTSSTIQKGKWT